MLDLARAALGAEMRRNDGRYSTSNFFRGRRLEARLLNVGFAVPSLDEVRACARQSLAGRIVAQRIA